MSDVLSHFFNGRSIAVIGASTDPTKLGGRPIRMNKELGFSGVVYPVHPTAAEVQGLIAYNSIDKLPANSVDCALVAVPQQHVRAAIEGLARKRVPLAIILSSGFAEHSDDGSQEQTAIMKIAIESGMRIVGPNSMGGISYETGICATFTSVSEHAGRTYPRLGHVSIASQSGFVGSHLMGLLRDRGIGVAKWLATGNQADIDISDVIRHYAEDEISKVIVVYVEGIGSAERLYEALALARARQQKVVAIKVGRTEFGAQAVASHTAALVGNADAYVAAFRRYGASMVDTLDDLVDLVAALDTGRSIEGKKLGIATVSGGFGILMSDEAFSAKFELPEVESKSQLALRAYYPLASTRNPVDMGSLMRIGPAIAALAVDDYDAVAVGAGHFGLIEAQIAKLYAELQLLRESKPNTFIGLSALLDDQWRVKLQSIGIFTCDDPTRLVRTMSRVAALETSMPLTEFMGSALIPSFDSKELISATDEKAARSILRQCGVPVAEERMAKSAIEAVEIALSIGGKVALKIASADIPHKTEVGGVLLGLVGAKAVGEGFDSIVSRVREASPTARIDGVLVSPMISDGIEVLVGFTTDEVFGPIVAVAMGGVLVEVLEDKVVESAPFSKETALNMVRSLKGAKLLAGYRGKPSVDIDAIADVIHRVSMFADKYRNIVVSLEINPLIARAKDVVAVDALLVPKQLSSKPHTV